MEFTEHKIKLTLTDAPPVEYKYPVGNTSSLNAPSKTSEGGDYLGALVGITTPHRVGVASSVYTDRIMRAFDGRESYQNVDPSFKPFDVWKDGGHQPEEYNVIGNMTNWEQYNLWMAANQYEQKNAEAIANSGVAGNILALAAQLGADPTTYAGFGAATMLSKGMSSAAAYGISSAVAGGAYEAIQQSTDIAQRRSPEESMMTIAAAGVIGTGLGKAVDMWASRKAVGALKATGAKDFHESSAQYINDAATIQDRTQAVGADVVVREPELSKIAGIIPRNVATALRFMAPRLRGQTASEDLSRITAEQFFGRTLTNVGDEQGLQRIVSFRDAFDVGIAKYSGKIEKAYDDMRSFIKSGGLVTEDDLRAAILRVSDVNDNLSDNTASAVVARGYRDFFEGMAQDAKNVDGFNYRQGYVPMVFNTNKIELRFNEFKDKFVRMFASSYNKLSDDLVDATARLARAESKNISGAGLEQLREEVRVIRAMIDEGPEEAANNAIVYASKFASGEIGAKETLNPFFSKTLPSNFKQRLFDIREFADFVEVNPTQLKVSYMREVMPFIASHQVYGERTPQSVIQSYSASMQEKIAKALSSGDKKLATKLDAEKKEISEIMSKGWDDITGGTISKTGDVLGSTAMNIITAAKNWVAATSLGTVLLASLPEFFQISMAHDLKNLPGFGRLLTQMASSQDVRQLSRKSAYYLSHAFSTGVHFQLMNKFADDLMNASITGSSLSARAARGSQTANQYMQVFNGNVPFTSLMRSSLAVAQQGILKESLEMLADGSLSGARKTDLAFLGISTKQQARSILKQAAKYGEEKQGNFIFNLQNFEDENARKLMEVALVRDNVRTSQNPGVGDVPHIFHIHGANLFTQFKSWGVMATHNIGIKALQRHDAEHLMNVSAYVGLSAAAYILAEVARGNEPPTDLDEIIYSGVTNSGIVGVLPDYGGHYLMNKLLNLESGGAKYAERQDVVSTFAGPLGTKLTDVQGAIFRPLGQAIDPNKDVEFNDTWARNFLDLLPVPFMKPYIKNELLTDK